MIFYHPESLKLNIKDYKSFFKRLFVEGVYLYVMIGLGRFLSVMLIGDLIGRLVALVSDSSIS